MNYLDSYKQHTLWKSDPLQKRLVPGRALSHTTLMKHSVIMAPNETQIHQFGKFLPAGSPQCLIWVLFAGVPLFPHLSILSLGTTEISLYFSIVLPIIFYQSVLIAYQS